MSTHNYTKQVNLDIIKSEIESSSITIALDYITLTGVDSLSVVFKATLSQSEETTLNSIISDHTFSFYTPQDPVSVEVVNTEVDDQGRQINRIAAASRGWTYLAHPIEFQTAKLGSLYEKTCDGTNRGSTIKFYDVNDVEVTAVENESSIVKTVVLIKPNYDYELVSGSIQQILSPTEDVRVWVSGGVPELGGLYLKEFAGGLNMIFYGANESLKTDGRAAKYMKKDTAGVPFQTNQLQIIVKHPAGYQHKLMLILEYFRA